MYPGNASMKNYYGGGGVSPLFDVWNYADITLQ